MNPGYTRIDDCEADPDTRLLCVTARGKGCACRAHLQRLARMDAQFLVNQPRWPYMSKRVYIYVYVYIYISIYTHIYASPLPFRTHMLVTT